jgi:F-box protein 21
MTEWMVSYLHLLLDGVLTTIILTYNHACAGGRFSDLYNSFPHHFLTTHLQTLPLSLVCIFIAIARRLGLAATPINSIGRVTAFLDGVVVDVFEPVSNAILHENLTAIPGIPPSLAQDDAPLGEVITLTTLSMLIRSGRNIMNSVSECTVSWMSQPSPSAGQGNGYERQLAEYVSDCIFAPLSADPVHVLSSLAESIQAWFPLDFDLVIRDRFFPSLPARSREWLECKYAENSIYRKRSKAVMRTPYMRYFVGQVVKVTSRPFQYCFIVDWQRNTVRGVYVKIVANANNNPSRQVLVKRRSSTIYSDNEACARVKYTQISADPC